MGGAEREAGGRQLVGALTGGSLNEPRCEFRFGQIQRMLPSGESQGLKVQIILQLLSKHPLRKYDVTKDGLVTLRGSGSKDALLSSPAPPSGERQEEHSFQSQNDASE